MARSSQKNYKMQIETCSQSWGTGGIITCTLGSAAAFKWLKDRDAIVKPADSRIYVIIQTSSPPSAAIKPGRARCLLGGLTWEHNMWADTYCSERQLQLKDTPSVCFFPILWVSWCLFCLCDCQVRQGNWDVCSSAVKNGLGRRLLPSCLLLASWLWITSNPGNSIMFVVAQKIRPDNHESVNQPRV